MRCRVCGHAAEDHNRRLVRRKYGFETDKACDSCHCVRLEPVDVEIGSGR